MRTLWHDFLIQSVNLFDPKPRNAAPSTLIVLVGAPRISNMLLARRPRSSLRFDNPLRSNHEAG
jgi:hypothetical protein